MICIIDISCIGSTEYTRLCTITFPRNKTTVSVDVKYMSRVNFNLTIDFLSLIPSAVTLGKPTLSRVIFDGKS